MRVLIVENDLDSRKTMHDFLVNHGDCQLVDDGLKALDSYLDAMRKDASYDLICLDINMPKVDGLKIYKTIREMENQKDILQIKRTKIVITTNDYEMKYFKKDLYYGFETFVYKPINIDQLIDALNKIEAFK